MNKIKFSFLSDIHIDFYTKELTVREFVDILIKNTMVVAPETDFKYLFLAGDYGNSNEKVIELINYLATFWEEVILVFGNHDYYGAYEDYNRPELMKEAFKENVIVLDKFNPIIEIEGIKIIGSPGWYNLEKPSHLFYYIEQMNDYVYNRLMSTDNIITDYKSFKRRHDKGDFDICITHTPPIMINIKRDGENKLMNEKCYTLEYSIKSDKLYLFGHSHEVKCEVVNESILWTKTLGYPSDYHGKNTTKEYNLETYYSFGFMTYEKEK